MINALPIKHTPTSLTRLSASTESKDLLYATLEKWIPPSTLLISKSDMGTYSVRVDWPTEPIHRKRFFYVDEPASGCDPKLLDYLIPLFVHVYGLAANEWTLRAIKKGLNQLISNRCKTAHEEHAILSSSMVLNASGPYPTIWRIEEEHVIVVTGFSTQLIPLPELTFFSQHFFDQHFTVNIDPQSHYKSNMRKSDAFVNNIGVQLNFLAKDKPPRFPTSGQYHQFARSGYDRGYRWPFFLSPIKQFCRMLGLSEAHSSLFVVWLVYALRIDQPQLALELVGEQKTVDQVIHWLKSLFEPTYQDWAPINETQRAEIAESSFHQHLLVLDQDQVQSNKHTDLWCEILTGGEFSYPLFNKKTNPKVFIRRPIVWGGPSSAETPLQLKAQTLTLQLMPNDHLASNRASFDECLLTSVTVIMADMFRESISADYDSNINSAASENLSASEQAQNRYKALGNVLSDAYFSDPWRYTERHVNNSNSVPDSFCLFDQAWSLYQGEDT
jgi:hypothetical protein